MDVFCIGFGVSSERKEGGWCPIAHGVYVEATPVFNFGWIMHHGVTAELEGRGAGAYTESRTMWGIGPYREWKIYQDEQAVNYYKNSGKSAMWQERMEDELASVPKLTKVLEDWSGVTLSSEVYGEPAKQIIHKDLRFHESWFGKPRGWQSWMYTGIEIGIPEPFITHHGIAVRAGFDLSEVFDFLLGFLGYDFKQDDRRNWE